MPRFCGRLHIYIVLATTLLVVAQAHDHGQPRNAHHNVDENKKDPAATMIELQLSHKSNKNSNNNNRMGLKGRGVLQPAILMQATSVANTSYQTTASQRLHRAVAKIFTRVSDSRTARDEELGTLKARGTHGKASRRALHQTGSRPELNKTSQIGLIIFAQGRTGTSSLSETIKQSLGMHYCYGEKESFATINISSRTLKHCSVMSSTAKIGWMVHVKPWHVLRNYPFKMNDPQKYTAMAFTSFFLTAKNSGFNAILSLFRFNQLARYISAFELAASHHPDLQLTGRRKNDTVSTLQSGKWKARVRKRFLEFDLVAAFLREAHEFINGTNAALQAGFPVAFMEMGQYVGDMLCPATKNTYEQVRKISQGIANATHSQMPRYFSKRFRCRKNVLQRTTSHRRWTMAERLGVEAAASVVRQLTGTEFQWMLDLSAFERPKGMNSSFQIPPPGVMIMPTHT